MFSIFIFMCFFSAMAGTSVSSSLYNSSFHI